MAVTRSRSVERASVRQIERRRTGWRLQELFAILAASALVAGGLFLVHRGKAAPLPEVDAGLAAKRLLNLNQLSAREDLIPALAPIFPKLRDRDNAARAIYYISGSLP